jgi:hypothetical protein
MAETPLTKSSPILGPLWYHDRMDVSVKGLEPEVVARLAEQAEREGVSAQEWMRQALRRTAGLLTPRELSERVAARTPVSEADYQATMETVKARRSAQRSTAARAAKRDVRNRGS